MSNDDEIYVYKGKGNTGASCRKTIHFEGEPSRIKIVSYMPGS